jgi:predicted ester cyclase
MTIANKDLIHRWFEEVWNKKREEAIYEMLHPQALIYGLSDSRTEPICGPAGYVPVWKKLISAFPDLLIEMETVVAEEDKVVACGTVRGTHSGPELGFQPTNVKVAFPIMSILRVKEGMVFEGWNNFDYLLLYKQLGVVKLQDPARP